MSCSLEEAFFFISDQLISVVILDQMEHDKSFLLLTIDHTLIGGRPIIQDTVLEWPTTTKSHVYKNLVIPGKDKKRVQAWGKLFGRSLTRQTHLEQMRQGLE